MALIEARWSRDGNLSFQAQPSLVLPSPNIPKLGLEAPPQPLGGTICKPANLVHLTFYVQMKISLDLKGQVTCPKVIQQIKGRRGHGRHHQAWRTITWSKRTASLVKLEHRTSRLGRRRARKGGVSRRGGDPDPEALPLGPECEEPLWILLSGWDQPRLQDNKTGLPWWCSG